MTIVPFQQFMQASSREIKRRHHRILSEAEIEALTDQEFIDYMNRRAAEYSTASAALHADFARRAQQEDAKRRIVTDDDFYLQGDYDQVDSRQRFEHGE